MTPRLNTIKNYYFPDTMIGINTGQRTDKNLLKKNLSYYIAPIAFQRIKYDLKMWRDAETEAIAAYTPQRIRMQRMFLDTGKNEHIKACIVKRNRLTTLRKFKICDDEGKEDEQLTKLFKKKWFRNFLNHVLNANYYGYSLISLGSVINDAFPQLNVVRRWNVSPDRDNVTAFVYSLSGPDFLDKEYEPWHIWVPTATESGEGKCGFGLFYEIAKTEILLRNNTQYNADYQEVFGQPIRVAHTTKTEEAERAALERSMKDMGSQAWIILDEGQDKIELVESKNSGTAFLSYGDFEKRMEARISKVVLGHADAMASTPGKLGGSQKQGAEESPQEKAMDDIQVEDGTLCEDVINEELIPRMRLFGFQIPLDKHFEFVNDNEDEEYREKEDKSNLQTATIAQTLAQANLQMDADYFAERTGIPVTAIAQPEPVAPGGPGKEDKPGKKDPALKEKTKNRLKKLYAER
jgi:hypothetical protein